MKKLLVTLAAAFVSASACGQGTIHFNNLSPAFGIDAPVFKPDGVTGAGADPTANSQLFLVTGTAPNLTYTALDPPTTFRTGPVPRAQAYVIPPTNPVTVPGILGGLQVTIVLRAWEGANFDTATVRGQSDPIGITLGNATGIPTIPAPLFGLTSFNMQVVPEPSTMALALLGAAALICRRRG